MMAFVDHGTGGTGEPLAALLRTGTANANNAEDQINTLDDALAQLPADVRSKVLVRGDAGSGVKAFVEHTGPTLAELEVRHRSRARCEDRIRNLKDTGATNLPLQAFGKNQIWLELAQLASELIAWTQIVAFADLPARVWAPKRLRLRILAVAGRIITTGRRLALIT